MSFQSRVLAACGENVDRYCKAFAFAEERKKEGLHRTWEAGRLTR